MLNRKKIIVTGSAGFIGSNLVRRLIKNNATVIELDLKNGCDLTDWNQLKEIKTFDILYHLASKVFVPDSYQFPHEFYLMNIVSTINVLELCRINQAKMIFASSYVYGKPQYLPIDESHPVTGFNPYAQTKIVCEKLCEGYARDHHVDVLIYRQANVYGKGQTSHFLIPKIIEQARTGKVSLYDATPKRDFVYIDDLINAYLKGVLFSQSNFEIFNIGSGKSYSVRDIVDTITSQFSNKIAVEFLGKERENEIMDTRYDIAKAKRLLDWVPRVEINEGIKAILKGVMI